MVNRVLFLVVLLFFSSPVFAFQFYGTTLDQTGTALNNTLVNVSMYNTASDFSYIGSNWTYTNASGWFNLTVTDNDTWMYSPVIRFTNNSVITHVGQSLPFFPSQVLTDISGINFFWQEAGTLIIDAVNQTGSAIPFQYQIKDQKLGFSIADNFADNTFVSSLTVYLPRDRNYSIMIFPNQSMPTSFDWSNFSANASYTFDGGNSDYNVSTYTLNKTFNMTMSHGRVNGYLNVPGVTGWDEFSVIAYLLEPGNMAHVRFGAVPYNLSSFFDGTTDYYNLSTNITNYSGFYNISLPSTVETSEMLLFAVARNGTSYWGGFHNVSLDYATYQNGASFPLNFSSMFGLLGDEGNITLETVTGGQKNVSTRLQTFRIVNESTNATLTDVQAHGEADIDYTAYGVKQFTWMVDSEQGNSAVFSLPLLNTTGIDELNIFAGGGDYEPVRKSYTASQIVANSNISLSSFNPGDIDGSLSTSSIFVSFYLSNTTCDIPRPDTSCTIGDSTSMESFNPLQAVMGGGKISFRMGLPSSGIEVHYVNVDMIASGPPSALFDDSASTTTSDGFDSALRFGSNGPTIYDYVLVSMPYTQGSDDETGLNDSAEVNFSIPFLYDDDWNIVWNTSKNGTNATQLGANLSHYSARSSEWDMLMQETSCVTNISHFNTSSPCYINTTSNKVWIRLPHFSGTGLSLVGSVITASATSSAGSSSGGGGAGYAVPLDFGVLRMQPNIPYKLNISNQEHSLYVRNVDRTNKLASFELFSEPRTFTLKEGESKAFDLTGDVIADVVFTLEKVYENLNIVEVSISYPSGEAVDVGSQQPEEASENTETSDEAAQDSQIGRSSFVGSSTFWWTAIFIILLALVVARVIKEYTKKKIDDNPKASKPKSTSKSEPEKKS